jgi:ferredoxin
VAVKVDRTRCEGTGFCARLAPDHFRLDGSGVARFLAPEQPDVERIGEAESLCPTRAIVVDAVESLTSQRRP